MVGLTVVHAILYRHQAEDKTQCQTTGIAHENLAPFLGFAEDIVTEERNQNTHADESKQTVHPQSLDGKGTTEHAQRYHTESGCQAVDSIYQIDGVCNEYGQKKSEGYSDERWYFSKGKKAVEIVDIEP